MQEIARSIVDRGGHGSEVRPLQHDAPVQVGLAVSEDASPTDRLKIRPCYGSHVFGMSGDCTCAASFCVLLVHSICSECHTHYNFSVLWRSYRVRWKKVPNWYVLNAISSGRKWTKAISLMLVQFSSELLMSLPQKDENCYSGCSNFDSHNMHLCVLRTEIAPSLAGFFFFSRSRSGNARDSNFAQGCHGGLSLFS